MNQLYFEILQNSIQKLFQEIVNDYGDEYDFDMSDLQQYYDTLTVKLKLTKQKRLQYNPLHTQINKYKLADKTEICQARTWGDGYMDTKHYRKYMDEPEKLDPTKIGKKCTRVCIDGGIYCPQHANKNTHGNFYLMPPKNKMGEYINNNKYKII